MPFQLKGEGCQSSPQNHIAKVHLLGKSGGKCQVSIVVFKDYQRLGRRGVRAGSNVAIVRVLAFIQEDGFAGAYCITESN